MANSPQTTDHLISKARSIGGTPPSGYAIPYSGIGDLLLQQTGKSPEKTWLIFFPDGGQRYEFSYSHFYDLVCRTANLLLSRGITRGDRIATVAFNHSDTVVQYFAIWMIGAVVVPINVGEDDKRIGYILQNSQAKLAFVREPFIERMEQILRESQSVMKMVRVGDPHPVSDHSRSYPSPNGRGDGGEGQDLEFHESIRNPQSEFQLSPDVSLEDEALIVYTSGTTGQPKGVVLTQYNLLIDAKAIAEWHRMTPDQRMMCVLPIHHVNGTIVTLMTPLYYGGSVVLNQKFHSKTFFERISTEKVHVVSVVPTLLQFLLHEELDMATCDIGHFRHMICGAGPLTCELASAFEERFHVPIIHGYGLSETTCYSCFLPLDLPPDEHRSWLGACGFPSIGVALPTNEMSIHDDTGKELPAGVRGEIVIRGYNVMKEYFSNPEANEKAFTFGWFRSGDEGFCKIDDAGRKFFFITGRIKELIIRGGVNISPFEIDEVLMNVPGVKAGLAIGFENDWYGEEVGAYVQTKDGMRLTERDLIEYCRKYLPFQKCPKVVLFGDDIPVTSTGKYQRNKLKPLFEKWKAIQFIESVRKSEKT